MPSDSAPRSCPDARTPRATWHPRTAAPALRSGCLDAPDGKPAQMRVPPSGPGPRRSSPPASSTRSRIPTRPKPRPSPLGVEPTPVVLDRHDERAVARLDADRDAGRAGVLDDVGERLLDDAGRRSPRRRGRTATARRRRLAESSSRRLDLETRIEPAMRSTSASIAAPIPSSSRAAGRSSVIRPCRPSITPRACSLASASARRGASGSSACSALSCITRSAPELLQRLVVQLASPALPLAARRRRWSAAFARPRPPRGGDHGRGAGGEGDEGAARRRR